MKKETKLDSKNNKKNTKELLKNLDTSTIKTQEIEQNVEQVENKVEGKQVDKPKKKKGKLGKYLIYCAIILILTVLSLYISLKDTFFDVINSFSSLRYDYLIYAVLCIVGVILCNALILFFFARRYKKRYSILQGAANYSIGFFYNSITPAQTGGQIMQAYTYKKQGIPTSNGVSCLVMNFIVYQVVLIIFATFSVIYTSSIIFATNAIEITINDIVIKIPILLLVILGFVVEVFSIGIIILMSYWKGLHNFVLNKGVLWFHKLHIVKDVEATRRKLSVQVESFKIELKNLFSNFRFLILIFLLHFISMALRYCVPYFLNIAVISDTNSFQYTYDVLQTISFTSVHRLVTELIPIPGGAGISEYFYYTIFIGGYTSLNNGTILPLVITSQILWRTLTFHLPLLGSGIISAFYKGSPSKEDVETIQNNNITYLTLQIQTIDERKLSYDSLYQTRLIDKIKKKTNKNKADIKEEEIKENNKNNGDL